VEKKQRVEISEVTTRKKTEKEKKRKKMKTETG
jgi:hypothetical protein